MNSQDWMDKDNNRQDAIDKLVQYCFDNGLDYTYTDKTFAIKLPETEGLPLATDGPKKSRKSFDIGLWGPEGVHEDELPPVDGTLNEGETPEETK